MDIRVFFSEKKRREVRSVEEANLVIQEMGKELNELYEKLNLKFGEQARQPASYGTYQSVLRGPSYAGPGHSAPPVPPGEVPGETPISNYRAGIAVVSGEIENPMLFSSSLYTDYALFVSCYRSTEDAVREYVGFDVTSTSSGGFVIMPLFDATVEYFVIPLAGGETNGDYRAGSVSATGGSGNAIAFSTTLGASYVLFVSCYRTTVDGIRETVGFDITSYDADGFVVNPLFNCTVEYFAIQTPTTANYRVAKESVNGDANNNIVFDSPLYTTYILYIYCYRTTEDAVRETVGFDITGSDSTGFVIVPLFDATVEYFAIPTT